MAGRLHTAFRSLISHPPAGYRIYASDYYDIVGLQKRNFLRHKLDAGLGAMSEVGIPYKMARSLVGALKKPASGTDLTITNGFLDFRKHDWATVVEEGLSSFMGVQVDRKLIHPIIESTLSKENCKGMICFNEASKNSLLTIYDRQRLLQKVRVIPPAIPSIRRGSPRLVNILYLNGKPRNNIHH